MKLEGWFSVAAAKGLGFVSTEVVGCPYPASISICDMTVINRRANILIILVDTEVWAWAKNVVHG